MSFIGANAQPFTTAADTVWHPFYNGFFEMQHFATNTSSPSMVLNWVVVPSASNMPASWHADAVFGICDNAQCIANIGDHLMSGVSTATTANCPQGVAQIFLARWDLANLAPGSGYVTLNLNYGSYNKRIVYVIGQFPTNVSGTSTITELLSVYPVPASNLLNVKYTGDGTVKTISIFDVTGKAVAAHSIEDQAQLDISGLAAGVYFLRLTDAQGVLLSTKKITKQ